MDMPISSIMEKHITAVDIDDTIDRVEEILDSHNFSCVPVIDSNGKCFGVISATDILHFHTMHKKPKAARAWEMCTHKVIEVSPDISVRKAAELMVGNKIHHIVVTENKSIKGIVSLTDIVSKYLLKQVI